MLAPVDSLDIQILVDNAVDSLSTVPKYAEAEWPYLLRRGSPLRANCLCCAAHGLSCLITARRGDRSRTVLFDAGPEPYAFERNATRLEADLGAVETMVLSHGHWDHAGGMVTALGMIRSRNGGRAVPFYTHPGMFRSRGIKQPNGTMRLMDDIPSVEGLTEHGATVVNTAEPQVFLDDMFFLSGEIPRVTPFEKGLPGQYRRTADGRDWEPDPWIMDERFLAVHVAGKGLFVFTACSHAGVVNVLLHARDTHPGVPVFGVLGGLHLSGATEAIIPDTVAALRQFDLKVIAAGHCTGWRAVTALTNTFGDGVVAPSVVGKRYVL